MKYKTLLFDIDNTLLDFDDNEAASFKNTMIDKGVEYTEELYSTYKEMNHEMWKAAEIDTCWICKDVTLNDSDIEPKYTIHSLKELFDIL